MKLLPIKQTLEENQEFTNNPICKDTIYMTIEFYKKVGFTPPWISYYAEIDGELVGAAAFKGKPINGTIEIAYGTFEQYQQQGVGTEICRQLVNLSLKTDPSVRITARTLAEENFSTKILKKNNFLFNGIVNDPEDGDVWEWVYNESNHVN
ncbi:MAG: GNAT family protein [Bacteroidota bacterium]